MLISDSKNQTTIDEETSKLVTPNLLYQVEIKVNFNYKYFPNQFATSQTDLSLFKYEKKTTIEKQHQNGVWHGILAKFCYSEGGKYSTDILINKTSSSHIMIGVAQIDSFPKQGGFYAYTTKSAWMFYCANGNKYSRNSNSGYFNRAVKAGEVVSVLIDMDNRELSFAVNYILCGKAYDVAFESDDYKKLALAIDLYNIGDSVTILNPIVKFQ